MDIASEVAQGGAARTLLSCRRPVHVVPRYIFGKPSDAQLKPWYLPCGSPAPTCMHLPGNPAAHACCHPYGAGCEVAALECGGRLPWGL